MSCKAINKVLGLELIEIPDWNCCSAMDAVYASAPLLSLSLAARNLSLAKNMNMEMVVLCNACLLTLSRANKLLHENPELSGKVNKILKDAGVKYSEEVKVRHYLDVLVNEVGFNEISKHVKVPLKELKVAPYYGCLLVRPPNYLIKFDDPEHPQSLDRIIESLGAQNVNFIDKQRCCGASLVITKEDLMMELAKRLLLSAKNLEADCIVTACPFCHFNLDAKQPAIEAAYNVKISLPILHFTQLIGIAFGLNSGELGLNRNCVSPMRLLQRFH